MGDLNSYKNKLKDLLGKAKLGRVIKSLEENIDRQSDLYNDFIGLLSRHNSLESEKGTGTLASQEARQESNSIRKALLSLISKLEEEDMVDFRMYREKLEGYERLIEGYENRLEEMESKFSKMREEHIAEIESYKDRVEKVAKESSDSHKKYLEKISDLMKVFEIEFSEGVTIDLYRTISTLSKGVIYSFYKSYLNGMGEEGDFSSIDRDIHSFIMKESTYQSLEREINQIIHDLYPEMKMSMNIGKIVRRDGLT